MSVRNSSKGRFWGCENYPDCRATIEYSHRPKTGLDLEIREIDNGYLIKITQKYAESLEDQDPREVHCPTLPIVKDSLKRLLNDQVDLLVSNLEEDMGFVDETTPEQKAKRVQKIKDDQGTKDVRKLMEKVRRSREETKT